MVSRLALAAALLTWSSTATAAKIELQIPAELIGGKECSIAVTLKPKGKAKKARLVRVTATGGSIGEASNTEEGFSVSYVPPRVAVEMSVTLFAEVRVGRRTLRTNRKFRLQPPARERGRVTTQGPFDLTIAPVPLILDPGAFAEVSIRRPTDGSTPRLFVSLGKVSSWELDGDRLRAKFTPSPAKRYPQAAVVAVVSERRMEQVDWGTILLHGHGNLDTTSEPHASVTVRIQETELGPFRADARGNVRVPILVPPGTSLAVTTAIDALGNRREDVVDLAVPTFNTLATACSDDSSRFLVFAIEPSGKPSEAPQLALNTSAGALTPVQKLAPGLFQSLFARSDVRVGEVVTLNARLRNDESSASSCRVLMQSGGVGAMYVAANQPGIRVEVDGEVMGETLFFEPFEVAAGGRRVTFHATGAASLAEAIEVELGRRTDVAVALENGVLRVLRSDIINPGDPLMSLDGFAAPPPATVEVVATPELRWKLYGGFGAGGLGIVGLGLAGYFGARVKQKVSRADKIEKRLATEMLTRDEAFELSARQTKIDNDGASAELKQWAFFATGTGLAITGGTLLLLHFLGADQEGAVLSVTPHADGGRVSMQVDW